MLLGRCGKMSFVQIRTCSSRYAWLAWSPPMWAPRASFSLREQIGSDIGEPSRAQGQCLLRSSLWGGGGSETGPSWPSPWRPAVSA